MQLPEIKLPILYNMSANLHQCTTQSKIELYANIKFKKCGMENMNVAELL